MSDYPLQFNSRGRDFFGRLSKAQDVGQRVKAFASARPAMFAPRIALLEGLTDPYVGLNMGQTAEVLAREWKITREDQDAFAMASHLKAAAAAQRLREETFDVVTKTGVLRDDEGVRPDSSMEKLAKLRPAFEKDARHRHPRQLEPDHRRPPWRSSPATHRAARSSASRSSATSSPSPMPASIPRAWVSARSTRSTASCRLSGPVVVLRPRRDQRGVRGPGPRVHQGFR